MIYLSHLIKDKELLSIVNDYAIGVEAIHFSVADTLDHLEKEVEAYKRRLELDRRAIPLGFHGPFFDLSPASYDSLIKEVTKQRFEQVYKVAMKFHAQHIIFHTGFIPTTFYKEGWIGQSISFWKAFFKDRDRQIPIYLENVFDKEYAPIVEVIEAVDHPNFKVCLDIGHVNAYSSLSIEKWIEGVGKHIGHVHLHNNNGDGDHHLGLRDGTLDVTKILEHIECVSEKVNYTLELTSKETIVKDLKTLQSLGYSI